MTHPLPPLHDQREERYLTNPTSTGGNTIRAPRVRSSMSETRPTAIALLACISGLVGCDHATKAAAEWTLRDRPPVSVIPGVVDLSYAENRDVAFDALSRFSLHVPSLLLAVFALATTAAVLAVSARRRDRSGWEHAGFTLIVAGALGNALDRLAHGHVVDFIHVHFWPVFNVADILVVAGVAFLLVGGQRNHLPAPD